MPTPRHVDRAHQGQIADTGRAEAATGARADADTRSESGAVGQGGSAAPQEESPAAPRRTLLDPTPTLDDLPCGGHAPQAHAQAGDTSRRTADTVGLTWSPESDSITQVDHPIASGYPGSCEMTPLAFRQRLRPRCNDRSSTLPLAAWRSADLAITTDPPDTVDRTLTIEEGVAVVTHHPDLLRSRNLLSSILGLAGAAIGGPGAVG